MRIVMDGCNIWKQKRCHKLLVDILLYLTVGGLIFVFYGGVVGTPRRGFFCGDETISLPYLGKDSVSLPVMILTATVFPGIVVFFTELVIVILRQERVTKGILRFLKTFFHFLFSECVAMVIVFVSKTAIGYPRPNFLAVCSPDIMLTNCTSGMYVSEYTCTNPNMTAYDFTDARQSFMSGHASIAASAAVFLIIYCEFVWKISFSHFMKPFVQAALLCLTLFVGYTRVTDNRHHWSDVFAGFIAGALVSGWIAIRVCKFHSRGRKQAMITSINQTEITKSTSLATVTSSF